MQIDYNGYNCHTFKAKTYFAVIRVLKSNKKKLALSVTVLAKKHALLND